MKLHACHPQMTSRPLWAQLDKMITLDLNEEFRWGPGCNLTEAYRGSVGNGQREGGLSLGFLSAEAWISGQIDHVAASEFPCQSHININDSARKQTRVNERAVWTDRGVLSRVIEAGANLDPVLVASLTNPPHLYLSSQNLIGGSRRILTAGSIWRAAFWDVAQLMCGELSCG